MEKQHYYTELHAVGIKPTAKHYATAQVCAHFSTPAKVGTIAFEEAREEAVEFYWNQQKRGWESYMVGKTYKQTGRKEITCMSPAYFEGHRSQPVFEKIDQFKIDYFIFLIFIAHESVKVLMFY